MQKLQCSGAAECRPAEEPEYGQVAPGYWTTTVTRLVDRPYWLVAFNV